LASQDGNGGKERRRFEKKARSRMHADIDDTALPLSNAKDLRHDATGLSTYARRPTGLRLRRFAGQASLPLHH
jgi:hypothetical protein